MAQPNLKVKRLIDRFDRLKNNRVNWETQWQDILDYCMPQSAFITRRRGTQGQKVKENIYDSTAKRANQILAAGFHGNLTNPSQRWFKLRLQEASLNEDQEVKTWLANAEDRIFDAYNGSNFNQQIHQTYLDLGSVGTASLYLAEDAKDLIRFAARPIEEIVIDEDADERVNTVYRRYKLSVKQAYDQWGEDSGKKVVELYNKQKWDERVEFMQCIAARDDRDPNKSTSTNLPFFSYQINIENQSIVSEGGFHEFPYMVVRFSKISGDLYGYSPASVMLPDIKMLNAISKTIIKGAQKIVDPPLVLPHDSFILPLKTIPGGINYRTSGTSEDKIEPLLTHANIPVGREMQNDLRNSIMQGYFADLFQILGERKNMTATEVAERISEKLILLGPVLGRLQTEMLDPIVGRSFGILLRRGIIDPPPEVLQGREMVIEYISPLALAQRRESVSAISNLLQLVGGMAQFSPEVIDKIDSDQVVDEAANVFGVRPEIIRDDEAVAAIRKGRAQQAQIAEMAQAAGAVTEIDKTASEAEKNRATANAV